MPHSDHFYQSGNLTYSKAENWTGTAMQEVSTALQTIVMANEFGRDPN